MQALHSPLSAVVLNGGFASGGIWQGLETFLMAWLGVGGPGAPGQNAATQPTVMAPRQRITQPQCQCRMRKPALKVLQLWPVASVQVAWVDVQYCT